jgi:hypothetical protein
MQLVREVVKKCHGFPEFINRPIQKTTVFTALSLIEEHGAQLAT